MRIRWNSIMAVVAFAAILSFDLGLAARQAGQGQGGGAGASPAGQRGGGGGRGGGQRANLPPAGPAPRLPNGKPDLSGHWANPYTPNMAGVRGANVLDPATRMPLDFPHKGEPLPDAKGQPKTYDLPYTDWGLAEWKAYDPEKNGDYAGSCLPFGMSRNINSPHGVQVIHSENALAFLFEQNTWFHWISLDPNFKWPPDLPPSWNGISTAHWDGDTLVVETTSFNGYTKLDTNGHPLSKEVKMTNTFLRTDSRTIQHTVTIHDPKAFTKDWMNVRTWALKPANDVIMEYSCEENNISLQNRTITKWKFPASVD